MGTYVVSDLHGQRGVFEEGLKKINFSDNDFLYVLGDAIDRGPGGIAILQRIKNSPNMKLLIGNHELFMANCINKELCLAGKDVDLWLNGNGGKETYTAFRELSENDQADLMEWLRSRTMIKRVSVGDRDFVLCHSHYIKEYEDKPLADVPSDTAWDIAWLSPFRGDLYNGGPDYYAQYPETFVIGHVPVQRMAGLFDIVGAFDIVKAGNVVDIDGGCAYGRSVGPLECGALFLRLEDMEVVKVKL